MPGPAVHDLEIYQGDTFTLEVRLRSVDASSVLGDYLNLTGSTVKAQVRDATDASIRAEFDITLWDQSSAATVGGLTLELAHEQTMTLPADARSRWDLQLTDSGGRVRTLLRGRVAITGEITE